MIDRITNEVKKRKKADTYGDRSSGQCWRMEQFHSDWL